MLEETLSRGEKIFLARHRAERSIATEAERRGVSEKTYRAWELDDLEGPNVSLGGLEPHEHYLILRFRTRIPLARFARMLGINYKTLRDMERGRRPLHRLIEYWGG
jgi:hypothetical protein